MTMHLSTLLIYNISLLLIYNMHSIPPPKPAESAHKPRPNFSHRLSFHATATHSSSLFPSQAPSHQCHESLPHTHAVPRTMSYLQGSKFGGLSTTTTRCETAHGALSFEKCPRAGLPVKVPRASGRNLASEIQRHASLWRVRVFLYGRAVAEIVCLRTRFECNSWRVALERCNSIPITLVGW
jgi:hypothetical protein